ncbi:unnamed protein product [Vitrella brassicaformis CCMP3155]|uniref:Bestrophin homolog n=1 Tax=Vitrella brassicaformis (strain CCMP3155) TaxID=1169540 RepID=A0A0G4H345_VITBC|nr:unnamed protein product [Vitrella brassicaformis CCMP3155]|eukprot:CEM38007.1 unnamed protein product [Vitrella brassicaformis CCMP3155]
MCACGVLWVGIEAALYYAIVFFVVTMYLSVAGDKNEGLEDKSNAVKSVATFLCTMSAFIVGLFTNFNISRWWNIRTEGIGQIWGATCQLSFLLNTYVKSYGGGVAEQDKRLIHNVVRYGRASLACIFSSRSEGRFDDLVDRRLLTAKEHDILREEVEYRVPCCIWAWVTAIIAHFDQQKKLPGPPIVNTLYATAARGRDGAAVILRAITCPLPLAYVHMISTIVKINNILIAIAFGFKITLNMHTRRLHWVLMVINLGVVFVIPFVYNGILAISQELSDPFGDDFNDFPGRYYDATIHKECQACKVVVEKFSEVFEEDTQPEEFPALVKAK